MAYASPSAPSPPALEIDRPSAGARRWPPTVGAWRGRDVGWAALALLIAGTLAVPTLAVLTSALVPTGEIWAHLVATVLPNYLRNTAGLLLGVGIGVLAIGVGTAWLTTQCRFPGRGLCTWALLLPMAMPAYIVAYTFTDLLDFAGPVQSALRGWFGWRRGDYPFPEIRSLG